MNTTANSPKTARAKGSCIAILGVPFDSVTMNDAVEIVEGMIESGQPHYLATANVDFTVQALEDEELRRILFDAHLVVCDGTPLLWASRWLGNRLPERVAGSDLVPLLIELAARNGHRLYFLGGRPDVTERAIANITRQHPALKIAGWHSPDFAPLAEMDHTGIGERIRAAKPDILLVSFGCPKQEKWIAMNYRALGVPVCIGVGATIDFLAGEMQRAPVWMRLCGLEWLFRLLQEPRRLFQRYVKDFWGFGCGLLKQWWMLRPGRVAPNRAALPETNTPESGLHRINLPMRLDAPFIDSIAGIWDEFARGARTILANGALVEFVDSTGIGALIRLRKRLRENGAELILVGCSAVLLRSLELMKLSRLFPMAATWLEAQNRAQQVETERKAPVQAQRQRKPAQMGWSGEVTAATVDEFWDRTSVLLNARAHEEAEMSIDLKEVRFVDSAGIGLMMRLRRIARQHGLLIRYVNPSEPVQRIVRLSRLEEFLLGGAA